MKKTLLLLTASLLLNVALAQDTVHVTVCTKFWKTNAPITGTNINGTGLDSSKSCADFEYILSLLPPGQTFSFPASKEQDDPLNGVTSLDLVKYGTHILGIQPLPNFGILAGDVNRSNSFTTFDYVETAKLILGIYAEFPNAPVWRFTPDFQLPFPNPSNPFVGPFSYELSMTELQALNGDTITLIGMKSGDVDGDANPTSTFLGPGIDVLNLILPDVQLTAGVPVTIPVRMEANTDIGGLQIELLALPGNIEFDSISPALLEAPYLRSNVIQSTQGDQFRCLYSSFSGIKSITPDDILFYLHLKSNADIALKDALKINQTAFPTFLADANTNAFKLNLSYANAVATQNPLPQGFHLVAATPNPFGELAQVQVELEQSAPVLFEVMDLTGKILLQSNANLSAGTHFLDVPGALIPAGSMVIYRVTVGRDCRSGKLIRSR